MNQQSRVITSKDFLSGLQIIHWSLFVGQLIMVFVAFVIRDDSFDFMFYEATKMNATIGIGGLIVGLFVFGLFLLRYIKKLIQIRNYLARDKKLAAYKGAKIEVDSFMFGVSLLGTAAYMITGMPLVLILIGLSAVYFIVFPPFIRRIGFELGLTEKEKKALRNPQEILGKESEYWI